jgi:hypothetical protein
MSKWVVNLQKLFFYNFDSFQGNLTNLVEMTHWKGHDVLYIGDHIYGDLAVSRFCLLKNDIYWYMIRIYFLNMDGEQELFWKKLRWVIDETFEILGFFLKEEINIVNSEPFQKTIRWVKKILKHKKKHLLIILIVNCSSMAYRSITSKIKLISLFLYR